MIILDRAQIEGLIDLPEAAALIEAAYVAASRGEVELPPVGHITFPEFSGDCHIKYGHHRGQDTFVIKVATGFPLNEHRNLPNGNGLSLVMSARTGAVVALLHDEMVMTDIRTGLGGAIATRALACADSTRVLIVGTGPQALRQIEAHVAVIGPHLRFEIWGRCAEKAQAVAKAAGLGSVTEDLAAACARADIIVTATGATEPFIAPDWITPGTHITAVGADAPGKQELSVELVASADVLVADSVAQCLDHGELSHASGKGVIAADDVCELGEVLSGAVRGRTGEAQISIADLTGIAAQDIAIANVVLAEMLGAGH